MKQQILVIEDEKITRDVYLDCLTIKGFAAMGASGGRQGLQLAQQHLPSLIVCDVVMPDIDGYDVLSSLRQNPATAVIPLIFVSAMRSVEDIRKGMRLGADDYITKPSTLEEFMSVVQVQIDKRSRLKSCYEATFRGKGIAGKDVAKKDTYAYQNANRDASRLVAESPIADSATADSSVKDSSVHNIASETAPRSIAADGDSSSSIFPSTAGALQPVFDFIEANYKEQITLADVAQAVGYSPAYLTSQVGEQTNYTVNRWIIERRMVEARLLLSSTDYKVEEIAAKIGYQNACHFSRQFRKYHGQPPNTWRNAQPSRRESA